MTTALKNLRNTDNRKKLMRRPQVYGAILNTMLRAVYDCIGFTLISSPIDPEIRATILTNQI